MSLTKIKDHKQDRFLYEESVTIRPPAEVKDGLCATMETRSSNKTPAQFSKLICFFSDVTWVCTWEEKAVRGVKGGADLVDVALLWWKEGSNVCVSPRQRINLQVDQLIL